MLIANQLSSYNSVPLARVSMAGSKPAIKSKYIQIKIRQNLKIIDLSPCRRTRVKCIIECIGPGWTQWNIM